MKKLSLLLVALFCSINFYGQAWDSSKPDNRLTFGIRAGVNMSTVSGEDNDYYEVKSRWNFHAGLNLDINIVKSFAVETGLFYTGKGLKLGYIYSNEGKLSYIQLPLLALYRLPIKDDVHVQLKAGGYFGYLVNEPEALKVKKPDMGVICGAGISYKKFYLGLQYEIGLYKCVDPNWFKGRNRNLAISLGYDF